MRVLFVFIGLMATLALVAQQKYPIDIKVVVPQPFPTTREEALKFEDFELLQITNTSFQEKYQIMLSGEISSDQGIFLSLDAQEQMPTEPIVLSPGEVLFFSVRSLEKYYPQISESNVSYSGIDKEEVIKTNQIPEGLYTICVRAYDFSTGQALSADKPMGCSFPQLVSRIEPPFLILPEDNSEFETNYPFIQCRWLPVVGATIPVEYHVEIVRSGGADPYDMFREGRKVFFETTTMSNNFILDDSQVRLPTGRYAIRVTAVDPIGEKSFVNSGHSDVHTFTIMEEAGVLEIVAPLDSDTLPPLDFEVEWSDLSGRGNSFYFGYVWEFEDNINASIAGRPLYTFGPESGTSQSISFSEAGLKTGQTYVIQMHGHKHARDFFPSKSEPIMVHFHSPGGRLSSLNTDCGGDVDVELPSDKTPYERWTTNDIIRIGLFDVQLNQVTVTATGYNGIGQITSSELFNGSLEVQLQNLKINRDGVAFEGRASASATDLLIKGSRTYSSWEDGMSGDPERLPYQYGELLFTKIELLPTGASASVVSATNLGNNRLADESTLWFVKDDLRINPGGFEKGSWIVDLDEPVTIRENSRIEYTFLGKPEAPSRSGGLVGNRFEPGKLPEKVKPPAEGFGDPFSSRSGTFATFDCDGNRVISSLGEIHLLSDAQVRWRNSESITGYFQSTFSSWEDAMGFVQFNPTQKNSIINETYKCESGSFDQEVNLLRLSPFKFEFCSAILDHSFSESPGDQTTSWQGVYFDKMKVKLPKAIRDGQNERLSCVTEAHWDGSGFYAQNSADLISSLGKIDEWVGVVTSVEFDIARGVPNSTLINGGVILPFASPLTTTSFEMNFHFAQGRTLLDLDIGDVDDMSFRFSPWNAQMSLDNRSSIIGEIVNDDLQLTTDFYGTMNFEGDIGGIPDCDLQDIEFNGLEIANGRHGKGRGIHVSSFTAPYGTYTIAGYGADVKGISVKTSRASKGSSSILSIDYEFKLDDIDLGFLGETEFTIESTQGILNGVQNYEFDKAKIKAFNLELDIPVLRTQGEVRYVNDGIRKEFSGSFSTRMLKAINLEGLNIEGRFGKQENFKYWSIGAQADLNSHIDLTSTLEMNSFGGGMYYNMNRVRGIGVQNKYNFVPSQNRKFGIVAGLGLEHRLPGTYAGRFDLSTEFHAGSLNEVELSGLGHFAYKGSAKNPKETIVILDGALRFNFSSNPFFEGEFNYVLNLEDALYSLRGESDRGARSIGFHFSNRMWYIRLGRQSSPINAQLSLKSVIGNSGSFFNTGATAYLETGSSSPFRFGIRATIDGHNRFDQELILADQFELDYDFYLGVSGSIGRNNALCPGASNQELYGHLGGEIGLSAEFKYWDRCDDWNPLDWDWDGDGDDGCDEWRSVFDLDIDADATVYGPDPLSATINASLSFTVVQEFTLEKTIKLASNCQ